MLIVRYQTADERPRVGALDGGRVRPLAVSTLASMLAGKSEFAAAVETADGSGADVSAVRLLAPVDGATEVWAAGVTYTRSRDARMEESAHAEDIYDRVYSAERPELFFKSVAWRVVGPGVDVSIRRDSAMSVPEPELGVVVAADAEVVGYTICNDMSSRDIEGDNPLYLPQAKLWLGSTALGPGIRPAAEIPDPYALDISASIRRGDDIVFTGAVSTSRLRRTFAELIGYLFREDRFPAGVVLSTGTGIVPPWGFSLLEGDVVRIEIEGIGVLENHVTRGVAGP